MNRSETETIRGLAAALRAAAESPQVVLAVAQALEALVRAPAPLRAAPEQLELAPAPPEALPERSEAPPNMLSTASEPLLDDSSRSYEPVPVPPSSSSTDRSHQQEKKTEQRIRPHTDDPLPEDFRAVYLEVVEVRGAILPAAEYVWSTFVEYLWAKEITFASRWNLKRRWRAWCVAERPIPASGAPEPTSPAPAPSSSAPVVREKASPPAEDAPSASRAEALAVCSLLARGELQGALTLVRSTFRDPPEPRAMSA